MPSYILVEARGIKHPFYNKVAIQVERKEILGEFNSF